MGFPLRQDCANSGKFSHFLFCLDACKVKKMLQVTLLSVRAGFKYFEGFPIEESSL